MNSPIIKNTVKALAFATCLCVGSSGMAATTELWFRAASVPLTTPGGPVTMWGFAQGATEAAARAATPTVPGPSINLGSGNQDLIIHLINDLPEPVSIVIPGLPVAPFDPANKVAGRARAFTREVAPTATGDYTWAAVPPGTYLYYSGSHSAVQVQMGLYGALTKLQSTVKAYQGVDNHQSEQTILLSELDPAMHAAVVDGTFTSALKYRPQYFMINGKFYTPGLENQGLLHDELANLNNNQERTALLRVLNAGLDARVPLLGGANLKAIAEDGKEYRDGREIVAPYVPALKTMDFHYKAKTPGTLPLYDQRLATVSAGSTPMVSYLGVSGNRSRTTPITFTSTGPANGLTYGAPINVSGLVGVVSRVKVTVTRLFHPQPSDLDIMLVGPNNKAVMLMSDVGGATPILSTAPVTLTFDEAATTSLTTDPLVSGTYKPTDLVGEADTFPGSLPASAGGATLASLAPYLTTLTGSFDGVDLSGTTTWRLYVRDNLAGPAAFLPTDQGIAGGWTITITPRPAP